MAQDARLDRYQLFSATAVLGAHAQYGKDGFRHRDVKFLMELFSNWLEHSIGGVVLEVQNTQVARYLRELVGEGYARKISRKGYPRYALTRIGLLELVSRLVHAEYVAQPESFYFLYYFIKNYRPRIEALVKGEGRDFPVSLKIELDSLLDVDALLLREIQASRRELNKLEARIVDARFSAQAAEKLLKKGFSVEQVVLEVQRAHPYQLNSQKPLSQLIAEIPKDLRIWELTEGSLRRMEELWTPAKNLLSNYIRQLESWRGRAT